MPLAANFAAGRVTQTGSPLAMTPANGGPPTGFRRIRLKNAGAAAAAIGGAGVTVGTGYPLAAGESFDLEVMSVRKLYTIGTAADTLAWIASMD